MIKYIMGQEIGNCIFLENIINPRDKKEYRLAKFKCKCGNEFIASISNVKRGNTNSCGCYGMKRRIESHTKHGLSRHSLYGQWQDIKNRCYNSNIPDYYLYGGKGVKVCNEWKNEFIPFYNWAISNNWEKGLSIDRINGNGDYEPSNCRLATDIEQARNRRNNIVVDYNGEKMCLKEMCERLNLKYSTIRARIIRYNWSLDKAINTEVTFNKIKKLNDKRAGEVKHSESL